MSYDIWLEIDTDDEPSRVTESWNYTSNCASMWRKAGADLAEFHGKVAGDCVAPLGSAIADMIQNPGKYEPMNPPNGWGSLETLIPALSHLLEDFRAHPKATVAVWR